MSRGWNRTVSARIDNFRWAETDDFGLLPTHDEIANFLDEWRRPRLQFSGGVESKYLTILAASEQVPFPPFCTILSHLFTFVTILRFLGMDRTHSAPSQLQFTRFSTTFNPRQKEPPTSTCSPFRRQMPTTRSASRAAASALPSLLSLLSAQLLLSQLSSHFFHNLSALPSTSHHRSSLSCLWRDGFLKGPRPALHNSCALRYSLAFYLCLPWLHRNCTKDWSKDLRVVKKAVDQDMPSSRPQRHALLLTKHAPTTTQLDGNFHDNSLNYPTDDETSMLHTYNVNLCCVNNLSYSVCAFQNCELLDASFNLVNSSSSTSTFTKRSTPQKKGMASESSSIATPRPRQWPENRQFLLSGNLIHLLPHPVRLYLHLLQCKWSSHFAQSGSFSCATF